MSELRYSLLTDGSSDRVLIPILSWLLREYCPNLAIQDEWADLRRLPYPPRNLADRIIKCLELYPCDLLFIHRDAEKVSLEKRACEIRVALTGIASPPVICVVPVRMQEAWLLFDEIAIRKAAGNPRGKVPLNTPTMDMVESLPDPKQRLYELLSLASGYSGRNMKRLRPNRRAHDVPKFIKTFAPLRSLPAFRYLEEELKKVVQEQRWNA
jgi:hypothetical protein